MAITPGFEPGEGGSIPSAGANFMTRREKELEAELKRIKDGIKHCDTVMMVDGNDMRDWGWTTIENMNRKLKFERYDY